MAKWMQKAVKRPGAFRAKAQKAGVSTSAFASRVLANPGGHDPRTVRQANLARTFSKFRKHEGAFSGAADRILEASIHHITPGLYKDALELGRAYEKHRKTGEMMSKPVRSSSMKRSISKKAERDIVHGAHDNWRALPGEHLAAIKQTRGGKGGKNKRNIFLVSSNRIAMQGARGSAGAVSDLVTTKKKSRLAKREMGKGVFISVHPQTSASSMFSHAGEKARKRNVTNTIAHELVHAHDPSLYALRKGRKPAATRSGYKSEHPKDYYGSREETHAFSATHGTLGMRDLKRGGATRDDVFNTLRTVGQKGTPNFNLARNTELRKYPHQQAAKSNMNAALQAYGRMASWTGKGTKTYRRRGRKYFKELYKGAEKQFGARKKIIGRNELGAPIAKLPEEMDMTRDKLIEGIVSRAVEKIMKAYPPEEWSKRDEKRKNSPDPWKAKKSSGDLPHHRMFRDRANEDRERLIDALVESSEGALAGLIAGGTAGLTAGGYYGMYRAARSVKKLDPHFKGDVQTKFASGPRVAGVERITSRENLKKWIDNKNNIDSRIPLIGRPIKRFMTYHTAKGALPKTGHGVKGFKGANAYYMSPDHSHGKPAVVAPKNVDRAIVAHEYGHAKDLHGLTSREVEARFAHDTKPFAAFRNAKHSGTYQAEVRAWQHSGVPETAAVRKNALDTYRHAHNSLVRYPVAGGLIGAGIGAVAGAFTEEARENALGGSRKLGDYVGVMNKNHPATKAMHRHIRKHPHEYKSRVGSISADNDKGTKLVGVRPHGFAPAAKKEKKMYTVPRRVHEAKEHPIDRWVKAKSKALNKVVGNQRRKSTFAAKRLGRTGVHAAAKVGKDELMRRLIREEIKDRLTKEQERQDPNFYHPGKQLDNFYRPGKRLDTSLAQIKRNNDRREKLLKKLRDD
jgi:hypothetical protein